MKSYRKQIGTAVTILVLCAFILGFFYLDRHHDISKLIQSYGSTGVLAAIIMMAILCLTPLPSEGLLVMYLKVYGVLLGAMYGWIGYLLSSLVIFVLARSGSRIASMWVPKHRIDAVDKWVGKRGVWGLLVVRLLPIPAYVVNYLIGMMPSISFWRYFWTGSVAMLPYYTGVTLVYLGVISAL